MMTTNDYKEHDVTQYKDNYKTYCSKQKRLVSV